MCRLDAHSGRSRRTQPSRPPGQMPVPTEGARPSSRCALQPCIGPYNPQPIDGCADEYRSLPDLRQAPGRWLTGLTQTSRRNGLRGGVYAGALRTGRPHRLPRRIPCARGLRALLRRYERATAQQAADEPARPRLSALVAHVPDQLPGRAVLIHGRTPHLGTDLLAQRPILQGVRDLLHDLSVHRLRKLTFHALPLPIAIPSSQIPEVARASRVGWQGKAGRWGDQRVARASAERCAHGGHSSLRSARRMVGRATRAIVAA